jgi:hypothetical protein
MADTPISGLTAYSTVHPQDLTVVVDTTDTTMASTGTDKKATIAQLLGAVNASNITTGTLPAAQLPALTGVVTSSAGSNEVAFAAITPFSLICNPTDGTLAPIEFGLSAFIDDAIGNTQGSLLYRNATGWVELAPGTSGQFLQTQGASENPEWATVSGGGLSSIANLDLLANTTGGAAVPSGVTLTSLMDAAISSTQGYLLGRGATAWGIVPDFNYDFGNNVPVWASVAAPTATLNRMWFQSGGQGTFTIGRASGPANIGGCIFSCGQCASVNNTTAQTSLFGSPTAVSGSLTIPANTLVAGNLLRWYFSGAWGCTGSGVTFSLEVLLNGSVILAPVTVATSTAAQSSQAMWTFQAYYQLMTVGSSGTGSGAWFLEFVNNGGSSISTQLLPNPSTGAPTSSFASNANALFDIKLTMSAASASDFVQINGFQLFLDN